MMRPTLLLLCALALVACDDDSTQSPAADSAVADLAGSTCPSTCGTCPSGTTCVTMTGGPEPFSATCLASCQTDSDCTGGRECVNFLGWPAAQRYCINHMEPLACGTHCDGPHPSMCNGSLLVVGYVGIICGFSYHQCANGCVEDAPDGGDNRQAHCN